MQWSEWLAAVGDAPEPFRYQSDEDQDGFLSRSLNSDGPLHGNCIPFAARSADTKHLYSRNVTTLHWPGIFSGASGTSGTISIDSGPDAARFLSRFGRTAADKNLLAPIQMNKNPPSGSRSASRTNSYMLLPRCDMDFKFHLPYEEAETYVNNDPDVCLLDTDRMRTELHFSDEQIQHHCQVAGEAVANMFGLEPREVAVAVMRSFIPNMDLVRVRRGDQEEFAPRREKIGNDVRGNHVLCGQTVLIKPSYWLIFLHTKTVTEAPSEVFTEDMSEIHLSALDINVARLFRLDEVSKPPTPGTNFQHPMMRMHSNMISHFRDAVTSAIAADFKRHPEMWTIHGHVVDGLENGTMNFFDNPAGQRLARATKVHDCVYHELYAEEKYASSPNSDDTASNMSVDRNDRQARLPIPAENFRCPFASRSCVCCKRGNAFKVPVPAVRFIKPSLKIVEHDKPLLRAKSMRIEFVYQADGRLVSEAMQLLQTPGWGPVIEQAWTCPYITTMVNECSSRLESQGVHVDAAQLSHNGRVVGSPAFLHGGDLRKKIEALCKPHGWVTPKSIRTSTEPAVMSVVQEIVRAKFSAVDTAGIQFYSPLEEQAKVYEEGCPEVPFELGKNSHVLLIHTSKSRSIAAILVVPVDDTSTPCMSLYCETLFQKKENMLIEAFRMDPTHPRTSTLKFRVNTHDPSKPTCVCPGVALTVLHEATHHTGVTPVHFIIQHSDEAGYVVHKFCTECGTRSKPTRSCPITEDTFTEKLNKIFKHTSVAKRKAASAKPPSAKKKRIMEVPMPPP